MNMLNTPVQAIRSLSFGDAMLAVYFTLGMWGLLSGIYKLLRRQRVTRRALDGKRKSLRACPLLANEPVDDETLARIVRHENAVGGGGLLCVGLGALVGAACGWLFYTQIASHFPPGTMLLSNSITIGLALVGTFLGNGLSNTLIGLIWRKPADLLIPSILLRMRLYRPMWFVVLECVIVATIILAAALTASGVVPSEGGFSSQQVLGLAILMPTLVVIFALGPEVVLWLSLRYPVWPTGLSPALALRFVASEYLKRTSAAAYSFSGCFFILYVLIGIDEAPFTSFALDFVLALFGIAWLFAFYALAFRQTLRAKTVRATFVGALAPLASDEAHQEA